MSPKFEFPAPGEFSQSYVQEVHWFGLVEKYLLDFGQIDVYEKVIDVMKKDEKVARHLNAPVGTPEIRSRIEPVGCLKVLLTQLLKKQDGLSFDEVIFDKLYNSMEDHFYRDTIEYRCLAPLHNFQMETEKLELSPGFSIIKIAEEEKGEILSESSWFLPLGFSSHQINLFDEFAFEFHHEVPKIFGNDSGAGEGDTSLSQIVRKEFDEACSALRLFKRGAVGYNYIRIKPTSWTVAGGAYATSSIATGLPIGTRYTLSNEDTSNLLKFWNFFKKAREKRQSRIEIALRRFNFGYEKARHEDKLIDWMIAFEALLLKGGERQELEYRLALRSSTLLGKSPDERENIFRQLYTTYKERSNIVHGGEIKESVKVGSRRIPLAEFVNEMEELLRLAIKEFLKRAENANEAQVIADLDEKIVRGLLVQKASYDGHQKGCL